MAWRKKAVVLFCFLVLVCLVFLQEYVNFSVKLYDSGQIDRRIPVTSSFVDDEKRNNQNQGSYTIIKYSSRGNYGIPGNSRNTRGYSDRNTRGYSDRNTRGYSDRNTRGFSDRNTRGYSDSYHDYATQNTKQFSGRTSLGQYRVTNFRTFYNKWTKDSDIKTAQEHAQRTENLKNTCRDVALYRKQEKRKGSLSEFYYSRLHKFAYCKVPKCGSTFWMNLFMILLKGANYSKLIPEMSRAEIHVRSQLFNIDPKRILHNNIPTVVVSRNPYTRLFSAYVDKVFIPLFWEQFRNMENVTVQPMYYKNTTIEVLKSSSLPLSSRLSKYRDRLRGKGLLMKKNITEKIMPVCANNATFEDFLRFIISEINSSRPLEPHWAPISHLCHPCKFNTFKIVKQESFSTDVEHTLQSVGINISNFEWLKSSLNENRAENSVPGIIAVIQKKFRQINVHSCITQSEISKRLWKSFQIQGYISKEIGFPKALLHDNWKMKHTKVTELVLDAISQKPMTSAERKEQREYFLKQAYSSISAETISSLQEIYYLDFMLFNYSMVPP